MKPEENKATVQRFWDEVFNQGGFEVADELFTSDHVLHHPFLPEEKRGPDIVKDIVALFRRMSPDIQVTGEDFAAEEDRVVSIWTARGAVASELRSAGDANSEVMLSGISVFRFSEGMIEESWVQVEEHPDESNPPTPNEQHREFLLGDQRVSRMVDDDETALRLCCWFGRCC